MTDKQFIFGLHSVNALLQKQSSRIVKLYIQQERQDKKIETLFNLAKKNNIAIEILSKHELDKITNNANHQGIIAYCEKAHIYTESDLPSILKNILSPAFILVLDGVQDPHNLGACFRSADAAGVHLIIAPKDKAVGITPIVTKVASGAAEAVPFVQVTNLVRTLEILKEHGIWVYGADADGKQTLYQTDFSGSTAIVLGAEGSGLRRLTREHCDALINIPMHGSVSSLNISVAAGIFLFEVVRQRQIKK